MQVDRKSHPHMMVITNEVSTLEAEHLKRLQISDAEALEDRSVGRSRNKRFTDPTSASRAVGRPLARVAPQGDTLRPLLMPGTYGNPSLVLPYMYPAVMHGQPRPQAVAPRQLPPYVFNALQANGRPSGDSNDVGSMNNGRKRVGNSQMQQTHWADSATVEGALASAQGGTEGSGSCATTSENGGDRKLSADGKSNTLTVQAADFEAGPSQVRNTGSSGQPTRARDRTPCAFFIKTGSCAYGDRCKFDHPYDKAPRVDYNSLGLPLRPDEPTCTFYVKNWQCAFGHTCKFNHPEPSQGFTPAAQALTSPVHETPSPTAASLGISVGSHHAMMYHSPPNMGTLAPYPLTMPYQAVPTLHPQMNLTALNYHPPHMANAGAYPVLISSRQNRNFRFQRQTESNEQSYRRE